MSDEIRAMRVELADLEKRVRYARRWAPPQLGPLDKQRAEAADALAAADPDDEPS